MPSNKKKLQTLVSTVNCADPVKLIKKMNVDSDVLIGNQCGCDGETAFKFNDHNAVVYSFFGCGVGANRNYLLSKADADIILFSDDDVRYFEGYADTVAASFEKYPSADALIFNLTPVPADHPYYLIKKAGKVGKYSSLRYGTPRIAIKNSSRKKFGVSFSEMFGGGAKYGAGEDSLFVFELIKAGAEIFALPDTIGSVDFKNSSWYNGVNDKFFKDKGVFYYTVSKRLYKLMCLRYCIKRYSQFKGKYKRTKAYRLMVYGAKAHASGKY